MTLTIPFQGCAGKQLEAKTIIDYQVTAENPEQRADSFGRRNLLPYEDGEYYDKHGVRIHQQRGIHRACIFNGEKYQRAHSKNTKKTEKQGKPPVVFKC